MEADGKLTIVSGGEGHFNEGKGKDEGNVLVLCGFKGELVIVVLVSGVGVETVNTDKSSSETDVLEVIGVSVEIRGDKDGLTEGTGNCN